MQALKIALLSGYYGEKRSAAKLPLISPLSSFFPAVPSSFSPALVWPGFLNLPRRNANRRVNLTKVQYTICGEEGKPRGRRRTFKVTNSVELPARQFGLILISTLFSNSTTTVLSRLLFSGCALPPALPRPCCNEKNKREVESCSSFPYSNPRAGGDLRHACLWRMKYDKTLFPDYHKSISLG